MRKAWRELKKKGQAALIVLLVVAVALGFGLSIISQSTTDVRISLQDQEESRAFNAAEAGIEEALRDLAAVVAGGGSGSLSLDDIEVNYNVVGETELEGTFEENETAQVILGGTAITLTIEWVEADSNIENPGNCSGVSASSGQTAASLLITVIDNNNQITRAAVNACDLSADNGISNLGGAGTDEYLSSYSLAVTSDDVLMRIRPIYNRASLRVTGEDLPTQFYRIDSTAQTETLESKAIKVTKTEPATPSIFDYVLFSGGNIIK